MPASASRPLSLSPRAIGDIAAIEAHYAQFSLATADRVLATIKTPEEFTRHIAGDMALWGKVARDAKISAAE